MPAHLLSRASCVKGRFTEYVTYCRMVFAKSLLPDGQSIIEQVCCLFILVLIPKDDNESDEKLKKTNKKRWKQEERL